MRWYHCNFFKNNKDQQLWQGREPIREALFGLERLEQHAMSLAQAQQITDKPTRVIPLTNRLEQNARALVTIYQNCVTDMEAGKELVPAAEWLLDNYHVVESQIQEVRQDLPSNFYRQLPKLADGPFKGYPRVFGLAWAFIAHTDSHLDPDALSVFITAYQRVEPLTIGELWAVPITLRIVLIESLCRLGEQITREQARRDKANQLADNLLDPKTADKALAEFLHAQKNQRLSETFAAQLVTRLRALDPVKTPALRWLEQALQRINLSVEDIVGHIEQRQSGANVSIRNVITSMRLISDIDWSVLVEKVSLVDATLSQISHFAAMNFATRNLYRNAIEELARHSDYSEIEVVETLKSLLPQGEDPGYYLIGQQRLSFERQLGFKPPYRLRLSGLVSHTGITGFVGTVIGISTILIGLALFALHQLDASVPIGWMIVFAILAFLPATDITMTLISRIIVWSFNPTILPGMALKEGIPEHCRTLLAVPTLLSSAEDIDKLTERLEVHYLTSADTGTEHLFFALITDWLDASYEVNDADIALLDHANQAIAKLNQRYPGNRFLLLHRHRTFNASDNLWMGWERKRGKLHELNQLLRGSSNTSFIADQPGMAYLPKNVRYVITLDSDTRLVSHTVIRLVGKMAHPLNQPYLDPAKGRITRGYGILQPRVTPAFVSDQQQSLFQRVFTGPGGIDPYASAASDLYQDLFHEGSFSGKGIYDIDAYEAALEHRIPENTLLSHDLFEGIYARAGLASDVEVVEDFPASYDVAMKRQHRWTRGDWQLLSWILNLVSTAPQTGSQTVPLLGRFKMLDNLRRSLIPPFALAATISCFFLPWPLAAVATLAVLFSMILPAIMPVLGSLWPRRHLSLACHTRVLLSDICVFRSVRTAVPTSSGHLFRCRPDKLIYSSPDSLFT